MGEVQAGRAGYRKDPPTPAQKNAQELAMDAAGYADQVFELVEANLSQSLETVRKGHDELKQQFRK